MVVREKFNYSSLFILIGNIIVLCLVFEHFNNWVLTLFISFFLYGLYEVLDSIFNRNAMIVKEGKIFIKKGGYAKKTIDIIDISSIAYEFNFYGYFKINVKDNSSIKVYPSNWIKKDRQKFIIRFRKLIINENKR